MPRDLSSTICFGLFVIWRVVYHAGLQQMIDGFAALFHRFIILTTKRSKASLAITLTIYQLCFGSMLALPMTCETLNQQAEHTLPLLAQTLLRLL